MQRQSHRDHITARRDPLSRESSPPSIHVSRKGSGISHWLNGQTPTRNSTAMIAAYLCPDFTTGDVVITIDHAL